MITINLLPKDVVPPGEGLPTTQILVILGSVLLGLAPLAYFLYVHFHQLPFEQLTLDNLNKENESLKIFKEQNAKLKEVNQSFANFLKAVDDCQSLRIPFSKKLYDLAAIIYKHPVWLSDLSIEPVGGGKPGTTSKPQFRWTSNCTGAADEVKHILAFHEEIQSSDFFKDFLSLNVFKFQGVSFPKYEQKGGWTFRLLMVMEMQAREQTGEGKK